MAQVRVSSNGARRGESGDTRSASLMAWDQALTDLLDLMVGLYPTVGDATGMTRRVGLPSQFIDFSGSALNYWGEILNQAKLRNKIQDLIVAAQKDFPNIDFPALVGRTDVPAPPAPRLDQRDWRGTLSVAEGLEKVIGAQATFLPISFLELGLERARSVVKVACPSGYGTGFLVGGDLLITNNHV